MGPFVRSACVFALTVAVLAVAPAADAQSPVDGFDPRPNADVLTVAVQSNGKVLVGGIFTAVSDQIGTHTRLRLARLHADGAVDTTFSTGANGNVESIAVQPDGKILVAGSFTRLFAEQGLIERHGIGRLHADGSVDPAFVPSLQGAVGNVLVQRDGKILLCGRMTLTGSSGGATHQGIGRLNADGSLDAGFSAATIGEILDCEVQRDGKIVIVGRFTSVGPITRNRMARLNADGSLDGTFDPGANESVAAVTIQPDGRLVVTGAFTGIGGGTGATTRNHIARVHPDGSLDQTFTPATDLAVADVALQADGQLVLVGDFTAVNGTTRRRIARVRRDGTLDPDFDPGAASRVVHVAVEASGKILIAGELGGIGGGTGTIPRTRLARLYPDGSVDKDFIPETTGGVASMALQPDGKIVVAGGFSSFGGALRYSLARMTPSGEVDAFNPGARFLGGNGSLNALAIQPDGKILVGGWFTELGGGGTTPSRYLGRLHADGTLDETFRPPGAFVGPVWSILLEPGGTILVTGLFANNVRVARLSSDGTLDPAFNPPVFPFGATVYTSARQSDGKIIIAGTFTIDSGLRQNIARLHADGSLDTSFNPGADGEIDVLVLQPDGKILVGGAFTTLGGGGTGTIKRSRIGRLNPDGSVDATFNPGASGRVSALALQSDGGILVGGDFTHLGGGGTGSALRNRLGRLHANGTLDGTTFIPSANGPVWNLLQQQDGKVLVAGSFGSLINGGTTALRSGLGRLSNASGASYSLVVDASGTRVAWLRNGPAQEFLRVTFDWSPDGLTYSPLGDGARVADGWRLDGLSLPRQGALFVRARGTVRDGVSTSSSLVQTVVQVDLSAAPFTDQGLAAGYVVRAVHFSELRARIDTLRVAYGLSTFPWTDPLLPGIRVRAVHLEELRTALRQVYGAAGRPMPSFDPVVPGASPIRADHIAELRGALISLESH